jgi:hypothetical protein
MVVEVDDEVDDDDVVEPDVDDVVVGESSRRPTPLGGSDEHAAASPMPISRIAATRSDPARRTARTVPGGTGSVGASRLLDDS